MNTVPMNLQYPVISDFLGCDRVWLYSGAFTGWWLYDAGNNTRINRIYRDYCKQNNLNYSSNNVDDTNADDTNVDDVDDVDDTNVDDVDADDTNVDDVDDVDADDTNVDDVDADDTDDAYDWDDADDTDNVDDTYNVDMKTNDNVEKNADDQPITLFDAISFDDYSDDELISPKVNLSDVLTDYTIQVMQGKFKIDLNQMKQINVLYPEKQRKIMLIDIPSDIKNNKNLLLNFLKTKGVKGIVGIVFALV